jgi:hypothetical protein
LAWEGAIVEFLLYTRFNGIETLKKPVQTNRERYRAVLLFVSY